MIALALGRFVARRPWSSSMALVGMTLGIVSIVSVHLISTSISSQLDSLVPGQLAGFTHFLHREQLTANDYFELRRDWRRGANADVESFAPIIDETTDLNGRAVRVIGVDLLNPDQVMLGADEDPQFLWNGVWVDRSLVGEVHLPVNGIIDAPEGTLLGDIGPAQVLLDWPDDRLSYLGIRVDDPLTSLARELEPLLPGFGAGFPASAAMLSLPPGWQVVAMAEQYPAREFGRSVLFNISVLGLLALLVAWLLIYQVSVSWLRHLWPSFERFHVLGVDWLRLQRYFLLGMMLLGVLASLLGVLIGLFLSQWLLDEVMALDDTGLQLDVWVVIKAAGSALSVCLIGGYMAFRQARRPVDYGNASRWIMTPAALVAAYCLIDERSGLAGGFFGIAVLALMSGFVLSPLLKQLRRVSRFIQGPYLMRLGVREAIWYPRDVSVAMAGLALAVGTAIGVGLMVDSFRADFDAMLEQRLDYDLVAEGDHASLFALQGSLANNVIVSRFQIYRDAPYRVQGMTVNLRVARVDAEEAQRYGDFPPLTGKQTLLSEQAARVLNAEVGTNINTADGMLEVVGVFSGFGEVQPRIIVDDNSTLARYASRIDSLGIKTASPDKLLEDIRREHPEMRLRLQTDVRRTALETFDRTFAITGVLIAIALLVATLGAYIAVTTLRLNRPTADRLLRTLGVNGREAFGMDVALGMGFGLTTLLIALPLGIAFGWILCDVVNPRAFGWSIDLQLSFESFLAPLALGLGAAIFACLLRVGREQGADHAPV